MKFNHKILTLSAAVLFLGLGSCKKTYLDRLPTDQAPLSDVFKTTISAEAALQGLHRAMYDVPGGRQDDQFGQKSIDLYNDLMGEDMPLRDRGAGWFVSIYNYTSPRNGSAPGSYPWNFYFGIINNANQIITNIDNAVGPQEDKDNIKGQALFYRAYAYYSLSLYYQHTYLADPELPGLPLYSEPTRQGNPRSTMRETYKFVTDDLAASRALLAPLGTSRMDKSSINIEVVDAISARVALSMGKYNDAANFAHEARQNYPYMPSTELLTGFNSWNNSEWIWGSRIVEEQASNVASFVGQMDIAAGGYAALGQQKLINRILFGLIPNTDVRKEWWYAAAQGNYQRYSQKKFRATVVGTFGSDVSYVRSAEMALIEAEALCQLNQLGNAANVLSELILTRQPDYDVTAYSGSKKALLLEIYKQRRIELWGEGFRLSDLKRHAVMDESIVPSTATSNNLYEKGLHREGNGGSGAIAGQTTIAEPLSNFFVFRIPGSEMQSNSGMVQNP